MLKSLFSSKSDFEATISTQLSEIASLKESLENSEPELRKQIEHLKTKVVDQFKKLENLTKDYQECCKSKVNLIELNSRLEEDLDRTRMELRDRLKVMEALQSEVRERYFSYSQTIVDALNDAMSRHGETEAMLANQIMELKNKLMESQSYFLRFDVMKLGTLQNNPARITLRRLPTGSHVLDIESKGVVGTYYDKMLEAVIMHPSKANRFVIKVVVRDKTGRVK